MRTVGAAGPINEKTYQALTPIPYGYAAAVGLADGSCTAITAAGQQAIGVCSSSDVTLSGSPAPIVRTGDAPAIAGAAIPHGSYVKTDAVGRFVPVAGPAGSGEQVVGRAESTASGLNDEFLLFVSPFVY